MKIFTLVISLSIFCFSILSADIRETHSFEPLFEAALSFSENSLVVLDVDRVLIDPEDAILRLANQKLLQQLRATHAQRLDPKSLETLTSIVYMQSNSKPIN